MHELLSLVHQVGWVINQAVQRVWRFRTRYKERQALPRVRGAVHAAPWSVLSCTRGSSILELALVLVIVGAMMSGIISKGRNMMEQARFQKVMTELTHYTQTLGQLVERSPSGSVSSEEAWRSIQPLYHAKTPSFQDNPKLLNGLSLSLETRHQKMYLVAGKASQTNDPPAGFTSAQAHMCQEQLPQRVEIINADGQPTHTLDVQQGYALRIEL